MSLHRVLTGCVLAGVALVAVVAACTNLAEIPPNQCGNSIVENEAGEQCDLFPYLDAFACYAPDAGAKACHVACAAGACPTGWGCGADGVCRAPTVAFDEVATMSADVREVTLADFDRDGQLDVLARGVGTTTVYFFDQHGARSGTAGPISLPRGRATAGSLVAGGGASLIAFDTLVAQVSVTQFSAIGTGINIWNGQSDRTLSPILFSTFPIPNSTESRVIAAHVLPPSAHGGDDEILVLAQGPWNPPTINAMLGFFDPSTGFQPEYGIPSELDGSVHGDVPIGRIPASSPCDSVVVGFKGTSAAQVMRSCDDAGGPANDSDGGVPIPSVTFAAPITGALFLVDWNKDTILDILTGAGKSSIQVALGKADGTFATSTVIAATLASAPLAVGDVDGDGTLDFVDSTGVFLSSTQKHIAATLPSLVYAQIADLNHDGFLDAVGISSAGVDFYAGTGTALLNHRLYDITNASTLAVGDFDGDSTPDMIVGAGTLNPMLWVMYGTLGGFPTTQTLVGPATSIQHIAAGKFTWFFGDPPDGVSSVIVIGTNDAGVVITPLQGHTDRQLTSPFVLSRPSANGPLSQPRLPVAGGLGALPSLGSSPSLTLLTIPFGVFDTGAGAPVEVWSVPTTSPTQILDSAGVIAPQDGAPPLFTAPNVLSAQGLALTMGDFDESAAGDEMVAAIPASAAGTPNGTLALARFGNSAWTATTIDSQFAGTTRAFGDNVLVPMRLAHGDFDGDGHQDLLVLYESNASPVTIDAKVLFGTGAGTFVDPVVLSDVNAAAIINARGDATQQIMTAKLTGVTLFTTMACAGSQQKHCFDQGVVVAPLNASTSPIDIACGDVNGDGVDDVVVANHSNIVVYTGTPAIR